MEAGDKKQRPKLSPKFCRPPKYKHKEEIIGLIDQYFKDCEGHVLKDEYGEIVYDKYGHPVVVGQKPPTVSGLALALGFKTRQSLLDYKAKAEFMEAITVAMTRLEAYTESRLYDREGSRGAQFSLQNNFRGWNVAAQERAAASAPAINIICDIPRVPAIPVDIIEEDEEDGE